MEIDSNTFGFVIIVPLVSIMLLILGVIQSNISLIFLAYIMVMLPMLYVWGELIREVIE